MVPRQPKIGKDNVDRTESSTRTCRGISHHWGHRDCASESLCDDVIHEILVQKKASYLRGFFVFGLGIETRRYDEQKVLYLKTLIQVVERFKNEGLRFEREETGWPPSQRRRRPGV